MTTLKQEILDEILKPSYAVLSVGPLTQLDDGE